MQTSTSASLARTSGSRKNSFAKRPASHRLVFISAVMRRTRFTASSTGRPGIQPEATRKFFHFHTQPMHYRLSLACIIYDTVHGSTVHCAVFVRRNYLVTRQDCCPQRGIQHHDFTRVQERVLPCHSNCSLSLIVLSKPVATASSTVTFNLSLIQGGVSIDMLYCNSTHQRATRTKDVSRDSQSRIASPVRTPLDALK